MDNIDTQVAAVIAELKRRRDRLSAAIAALTEIVPNGAAVPSVSEERPLTAYERKREKARQKKTAEPKRRKTWLRNFVLEAAKELPSITVKAIRDRSIEAGLGDLSDVAVRSSLGRLMSHGKLRKIAPGEYAATEAPTDQTPERQATQSPLQDLVEQAVVQAGGPVRLRDLTLQVASTLGDKAPSMETIGSTLVALTRKGKIKRVGLGTYSK